MIGFEFWSEIYVRVTPRIFVQNHRILIDFDQKSKDFHGFRAKMEGYSTGFLFKIILQYTDCCPEVYQWNATTRNNEVRGTAVDPYGVAVRCFLTLDVRCMGLVLPSPLAVRTQTALMRKRERLRKLRESQEKRRTGHSHSVKPRHYLNALGRFDHSCEVYIPENQAWTVKA